MSHMEDEIVWKHRIQQKVRSKTSAFKVTFAKAEPVSGRLHPKYPEGNYIILTFMSSYRYNRTPPHIFQNEKELDNFLRTFM